MRFRFATRESIILGAQFLQRARPLRRQRIWEVPIRVSLLDPSQMGVNSIELHEISSLWVWGRCAARGNPRLGSYFNCKSRWV